VFNVVITRFSNEFNELLTRNSQLGYNVRYNEVFFNQVTTWL